MSLEEWQDWKKKLRKWALELGFIAVGFTTAQPIKGLNGLLQVRLEQGVSTPFESQIIQQRVDPKAVWQDCRGVVALGYELPLTVAPEKGEGILARSAIGEDYHRVINQKLKELAEIMAENHWPGAIRWQVDTGPLVERAFAVRAGLGWIGRNQQLIIPGYGSFVGLALLLLNHELPSDEMILDKCGSCRKCIQACPAQILGKEIFAAKRCYSYLTQSKEVLTPEERIGLGNRIFGCDTCQEACPHNQQRLQEEMQMVSAAGKKRGVDLVDTLNLTKGEFRERFLHTAAGWRGKGILQRNAFLALRNLQDPRLKSWLVDKERALPPILTPYLEEVMEDDVQRENLRSTNRPIRCNASSSCSRE
ncbi:tRNA epoxyqueuosine(34) reductase QueG [Desulfosporosinus sp. FKA]|uniref:tRNA epoxyqueuosine(34) reductase QueG n=1 Tax=Desulfosporosinus sp. FKA TaxID=1969834 RepID=UPI000B4A3048|nr:tRNA epoxyqueuosine(34) reductase QueG [Desulfosporosinus sp. FKA]